MDRYTGFVGSILSECNSNIPVSRRTLIDHLENGDYFYRTRSGEVFDMDPLELKGIADICTDAEKVRLRIPIIVSTDTSAEGGAWKVDGETETSVMSKILGKRPYRTDMLRFYNPNLADLRRKYPTAVVLAFIP
ncbi:MAG: DUF61 family protein [Methanomassiliicoccaceae archaeon]|nr:DUF61 family protein [Methanomassiliicoccaceae archaeon]